MLEEILTYFRKFSSFKTKIKYESGLPNVKPNFTPIFHPFADSVKILDATNGKDVFTIYKKDIQSIETLNDALKQYLYFNITKENVDYKIAFVSSHKDSAQEFTNIKHYITQLWKLSDEKDVTTDIKIFYRGVDKENKEKANGCLIVGGVLILLSILFYFVSGNSSSSSDDSDINACLISEDFIKRELNFPKEASFPFSSCNSTDDGGGKYTVLRKVSAKNAFGMEKEYIYKVELRYKGGETIDTNNWELIKIRSEEYKN